MRNNKRKNKYIPKPFESLKGEGDTSANIYTSMQTHPAWRDLKPREKTLYLAVKAEYYNYGRHDKDIFTDEKRLDQSCVTFNQGKWIKGGKYDLYSNKNSFYDDMAALIAHGFIDCVELGQSTQTKNLYRFSTRWKLWGTPKFELPYSVMTGHMLHQLKK